MSLKIVIITQGVSRIVAPLVDSDHQVVGMLESAPRGAARGRFSEFARNVLAWLANCLFAVGYLKGYCRQNGIAYRLMHSSTDAGLEQWLRQLQPDVIVVHSMSQLLRRNIYSLPRLGTINLHPSYLPSYRGPNPDFWHYYDVELNPGATVHFVDDGEDSGDILLQEKLSVPLGMKSPERSQKVVSELGVALLLRALDQLEAGAEQRVVQTKDSPTVRARNLKVEEHDKIIDWQAWPIEKIWHVLRGTEQWLNAVTPPQGLYRGQRWSVEDYRLEDTSQLRVGRIYRQNGVYRIACKEGTIKLTRAFSVKRFAVFVLAIVLRRGSL